MISANRGAALAPEDPLAREAFLAIADLDDAGRDARVFLAAPIDRAEIEALFADRIETVEEVSWDERAEAVAAARQVRLGALILEDARSENLDAEARTRAMLAGIRMMGIEALPWTPALRGFQARNRFLHRHEPGWPDFSDVALLADIDEDTVDFRATYDGEEEEPLVQAKLPKSKVA